jgi:hypothetical protein
MEKKFVPDDFVVPAKLETERFRLRMLTVDDAEKDYDAVMSSIEHLKNPSDPNSWPMEDMTLDEDREDLRIHQEEFQNRVAFAYTVMSLNEDRCLGCVYIDPPGKKGFDSKVYLWARSSELASGFEELLYKVVKKWVKDEWPFRNTAYPGREIGWDQWESME